jgi:Domain of unknown function (DUF397)
MTAAWRKFQRDTSLINQVRDYGLAHPDATVEDALAALEEPATADNALYAGTGLFLATQTREVTTREGLAQAPLGEAEEPKENTMSDINPDSLKWFKSGFSAAGACVEVAVLPNQAGVAVRDSKDHARPPHYFTSDEWAAFVSGVKAGEFDLP